jgi:DNA uptake protein ComE-like DNA-binding protein
MTRRILSGTFLITLLLSLTASAAQIKEMKKTSPTPVNTRAPANAVDINSATENELVALGIERTTAKKIVDARPFRNKRDLVTKQLLTTDQYDKLKDKLIAKRTKKPGGE